MMSPVSPPDTGNSIGGIVGVGLVLSSGLRVGLGVGSGGVAVGGTVVDSLVGSFVGSLVGSFVGSLVGSSVGSGFGVGVNPVGVLILVGVNDGVGGTAVLVGLGVPVAT